jgi:quercetin dioxygenase-like cupin family protein
MPAETSPCRFPLRGRSVLESLAPHGDSPPLHIHHTEDEVFHVIAGELRFQLDDQDVRLAPGETLLAPKGVPHTYRVESHRADG